MRASHPRVLGRCLAKFVHRGIKNIFVLQVVWTDWQVYLGGGAGDDKRKKGKSFLVVRNDILSGTRRCGGSRFCFRGHFLKEHPDCSQWEGNTEEGLEVGAGTR